MFIDNCFFLIIYTIIKYFRSTCSRECGGHGHQIRNRMCSNSLPSNRGSYCVGYSFDQRPCEGAALITCSGPPVNGAWSNWTEVNCLKYFKYN